MSLLLVCLFPLLLTGLVLHPASRRVGMAVAPWAALPGLALALAAPEAAPLELPWLLLGSRFGLDDSGRLFLLFTSVLWLAAGIYARAYLADDPRRHVFTAFFLTTLAGNLGVCLALDAASFYLAFAVLTFAAYGLVVHTGDAGARRAGRVYIVMTVAGEALLIAGLVLLASAAGTHVLPEMARGAEDTPALAYVLLFLGFGIKAGVPLLHMWLPLAYLAAPTPASAVLSGALIKAGLLGWLRFLPLGETALPQLGTAMLGLGLVAVFLGVAVGLTQRDAKTVLAYSSVSQMGFLTLAVGAGLLAPHAWPLLLPAIVLYALHHGLAKGALFLSVGVAHRRGCGAVVWAGLLLPALALAGAPLTSGAFAKTGLKTALAGLPAPWPDLLAWVLPLAAVGTALLMLRFLWLLRGERGQGGGASLLSPWLALLSAVAAAAWIKADHANVVAALSVPGVASAIWPLLAAGLLAIAAWRRGWRGPAIPPGDVLAWLERARAALPRVSVPELRWLRPALVGLHRVFARLLRLEQNLHAWPVVGALWLLALAVLAGALLSL